MTILDILASAIKKFLRCGCAPITPNWSSIRQARLFAEVLDERIVPADYYWRPKENLAVLVGGVDHWLTATAGNWNDSPDANANVYNVAPGANDKLIVDNQPTKLLYINVAVGNNPAASNTFAAIEITGDAGEKGEKGVRTLLSLTATPGLGRVLSWADPCGTLWVGWFTMSSIAAMAGWPFSIKISTIKHSSTFFRKARSMFPA